MKTIVNIYKNGVLQQGITPIFGNDIVLNRSKEGEEMFLRESLEGTWNFLTGGYDLFYNAATSDKFEIEVMVESGGTTTNVGRGHFYKYDCEFDVDAKRVKVKATYTDNYTQLLAKISNEYDIVQLATPATAVNVTKRAVLQFYAPGDTKITNVIGGAAYEVDCTQSSSSEMAGYHFSLVNNNGTILILDSDIYDEPNRTQVEKDFLHAISGLHTGVVDTSIMMPRTFTAGNYRFVYFNAGGGVEYYHIDKGENTHVDGFITGKNFGTIEQGSPIWIYYRPGDSGQGTHIATTSKSSLFASMFGRVVFDKEDVSGASQISTDNDITEYNLNYRYCKEFPSSLLSYIKVSTSLTTTPTKWGKTEDGLYYYNPPAPTNITYEYPVIPLGATFWGYESIWFIAPSQLPTIYGMDTVANIKDTYALSDVIEKLLSQIDPTIHFGATSAYSQFLYPDYDEGDEPVEPVMDSPMYPLLISPISNIKKTYYSTPAQKGKITLKAILDMLRSCYQLYWFIEETGEAKQASFYSGDYDDSFARTNVGVTKRLRIEHISYFKNGYSYTGTPTTLANLTTMESPRSGRPWSEGLTKWSYDKDELPSRYEFGWNTSTTEPFNGYPIKTLDVEVQDNSKKEMTSSPFDADVDIILATPSLFSDDGFVVMSKNLSGNIPISIVGAEDDNAIKFYIQNGMFSFLYLSQKFYLHSLGGVNNELDGYYRTKFNGYPVGGNVKLYLPFSSATKRDEALVRAKRQSSITFPLDASKVHDYGKIITGVGAGMLDSLKWNIETGIATAEILFTPN